MMVQEGHMERNFGTRRTSGKESWYEKDIWKGMMVQGGHLERNYSIRWTHGKELWCKKKGS
jgi:hypothetical protein